VRTPIFGIRKSTFLFEFNFHKFYCSKLAAKRADVIFKFGRSFPPGLCERLRRMLLSPSFHFLSRDFVLHAGLAGAYMLTHSILLRVFCILEYTQRKHSGIRLHLKRLLQTAKKWWNPFSGLVMHSPIQSVQFVKETDLCSRNGLDWSLLQVFEVTAGMPGYLAKTSKYILKTSSKCVW